MILLHLTEYLAQTDKVVNFYRIKEADVDFGEKKGEKMMIIFHKYHWNIFHSYGNASMDRQILTDRSLFISTMTVGIVRPMSNVNIHIRLSQWYKQAVHHLMSIALKYNGI